MLPETLPSLILVVCPGHTGPWRPVAAGRWGSSARLRSREKWLYISFYVAAMVKPLWVFFIPCILWTLCHMPLIGLAASCGVGHHRLQRPSIRAGTNARHPMLSASFDDSWKACGRRPHLYNGVLRTPGNSTGHLHQYLDQGVTQHHHIAYAALSAAPSGNTPVSRKRHRAISHLRATATIPIRLRRLPPPPKRSRNQQLRALSGW